MALNYRSLNLIKGENEMKIADVEVGDNEPAFVIAELGNNHQGNLETCIEMIEAAARAGASAVKLQKRSNRDLYAPSLFDSPYANENSFGSTYGAHREFLEFGKEQYLACIEVARKNKIVFFATAFDYKSADFLAALDVPAFKIASGDLRSIPLIQHIASYQKPIILSTGGGTLEDVDRAVEVLENAGVQYSILQCTAAYPPSFDQLDLRVIETFRARYRNAVIGYSGHDSGIAMSLVAYTLGARVIEKHFTLNRAMQGTDHAFSLEPDGMRKLIRDLNRTRLALGDGTKRTFESEVSPVRKMGKAIYASRNILKGEVVLESDLELRSPADGLAPFLGNLLVGKTTNRDIQRHEPFLESDIR